MFLQTVGSVYRADSLAFLEWYMTYIEFFDSAAVENICACLCAKPDKVILVGDKRKTLDKHIKRYKSIFENRGVEIEFVSKTVNRNDLSDIVSVFSGIIEENDDCVFDLTGGEDLYLVAAGIVKERYSNKNIKMCRFNLRSNTVTDCGSGDALPFDSCPCLSITENIRIYGGDVVYDYEKPDTTYPWTLDEDFIKDIDTMWKICKNDTRLWNVQMGILAAAESRRTDDSDELFTCCKICEINDELRSIDESFVLYQSVVGELYKAGLVSDYSYDDDFVRVAYKNAQVKKCLLKAGLVLEMKIYVTALAATDQNGEPIYNDVMNGVFIDWDGVIGNADGKQDTENEIDVMMMRGALPIFVSCKNGYVDMDELYKLNTVAEKFGSRYAKKVLITSSLDPESPFGSSFKDRAENMGIRVIWDVDSMSEETLLNTISNLWCTK